MLNKKELRQEIRLQKRSRSLFELEKESADIIHRLYLHPQVRKAQCVLLYYPLPDEVDTRMLIKKLKDEGKTVLLPKVISEEDMELRLYRSEKDLEEGTFHIMEPTGPVFQDYASIDVALVPGMSFDEENNRLGRGKGYYDRFLKLLPNTYKIGVCFGFQKRKHLSVSAHDIKMNETV